MKGFIDFIREQGVIGLAVGFILGGSVSKVVSALVTDIVNPFLGLILGSVGDIKTATISVAGANIMYGNFLSVVIDFVVVAMVVYFIVKGMGIDKIDKKKE